MEIDFNFNMHEWVFERSSGFAGYRNLYTQKWIYEVEYMRKVNEFKEYRIFCDLCSFFEKEPTLKLFQDFKTKEFIIDKNIKK